MSMKTIKKKDIVITSGGVKYYWCPYCGKGLSKKSVEKLQCSSCLTYLVGTADGGIATSEYKRFQKPLDFTHGMM